MDQTGQSAVSHRRLTSVLALDICGYTVLSERDEAAAIKAVRLIFALLEGVTETYHGRIFHKAGDGFLAEFPSAGNCLKAALQVLDQIRSHAGLQLPEPVKVRIGLHVGDVAEQPDGDLLGHGVNIAARLQEQAEPNGILASANIMNLVAKDFDGQKRRRGPLALKNISEAIEAYDIEGAAMPARRYLSSLAKTARKHAVLGVVVIAALAFLVARPLLGPSSASAPAALDQRVDTIVTEYFPEQTKAASASSVDAAYIRGVLRRLGGSRKPTDRATFALLEQGNVLGAIEVLETHLQDLSPTDQAYPVLLHQIGALAYQYAPRKAVAAYESLLLVDPDDVTAKIYLGHSLVSLDHISAAIEQFDLALSDSDISEQTYIELKFSIAFAQIARGRFDSGVEILTSLEEKVMADGSPRLLSKFKTEMAIAHERLDRLDEAEANLLSALDLQRKHGFDHDLERSYNVLGLIAEKRAILNPDLSSSYFEQAARYYELQYQTNLKIGKKRGIAEALYFVGDMKLRAGDPDGAERAFLEVFRMSREYGIDAYEMLVLIGLAEVAAERGNNVLSCKHMAAAQDINDANPDHHIGVRTAAKIRALACPFQAQGVTP